MVLPPDVVTVGEPVVDAAACDALIITTPEPPLPPTCAVGLPVPLPPVPPPPPPRFAVPLLPAVVPLPPPLPPPPLPPDENDVD